MNARNDLCSEEEFEVRLQELAALTKPEHTAEVITLTMRLRDIFDSFREI